MQATAATHPFFSSTHPRLSRLLCQVSSSSPWTVQAMQGQADHNSPDLAGSGDWEGWGCVCLVARFLSGVRERWLSGGLGMGWGSRRGVSPAVTNISVVAGVSICYEAWKSCLLVNKSKWCADYYLFDFEINSVQIFEMTEAFEDTGV